MHKLALMILLTVSGIFATATPATPNGVALATSPSVAASTANQPQLPITQSELPAAQLQPLPPQRQLSPEVAALRAQNKIIKEYQEDLLETVYWALGVAVTLTLLLAGFGWFTNYRMYEADKEALKAEFDRKIANFDAKLTAALTLNQAESIAAVDARIEAHGTRWAGELSAAEARLSKHHDANLALIAELKKAIALSVSKAKGNADTIVEVIRDLRMVEQHVWELKDIPENMLLSQVQALEAANDGGDEFYIKYLVKDIKKTLEERFIAKGLTVNEYLFDEISTELVRARKKDAAAVAEVHRLLDGMRDQSSD